MKTQRSSSLMADNKIPPITQFFKTLKPNSSSSSSISPNFKPIKSEYPQLRPHSSSFDYNMADLHQHSVSDVLIFEPDNRRNKMKNKVSNFSESVFIDLNDDDYVGNGGYNDDNDCVFVKKEVNLTSKGESKKDPICIFENYVDETPKLGKKLKNCAIGIDDFVQCVDDYDDNDEIRILDVKPSSSSSSSSSLSSRKRRRFFSGVSISEVGESSGSKTEEKDEVVTEIDPVETMFLCEICADSKPKTEAFKIKGCSHSYCSECMQNYVASKLQDGVSMINCPVPSCSGVLEPEYCRDILPFEVFVRWGNLLCESVILASQKFYCPFKDCSALLVDDGSEKVTSSECPSCFRLFCAQCKVAWHAGINCAEYQSLNKDERERDDIMLRNLAKKKNWQRCPKCKYYVEKSEGCLYMKCRCGVAFCYSCGSIHKDHRYHYCKKCGR